MPYYVVLGNYTDKGIQAVKAAPDRMAGAAARVEKLGGRIEAIYFTLGAHDFVGIFEFPDDETMLTFSMGTGKEGNIRFTTLKAFPKSQAVELIDKLSLPRLAAAVVCLLLAYPSFEAVPSLLGGWREDSQEDHPEPRGATASTLRPHHSLNRHSCGGRNPSLPNNAFCPATHL